MTPSGAFEEGRLPDFFIVGHQKCGTTALYLMLQDHPQIFMCTPKEPMFFASDLRFPRTEEQLDNRTRPHKLEHYRALFADAAPGQLAGEASAWYLRSGVAAGRIAELRPKARIVAILREPTSYLRAFHLQMLRSHQDDVKDLGRAMELERERRAGRRIPPRCPSPPALFYSEHVRYVEQLRRYHAVFPREQVLVLIYEDFRRDNEGTVHEVRRFLDIDDSPPIARVETQPGQGVRSVRLLQLKQASRKAGRRSAEADRAGRTMNALIPRRVRETSAFRKAVRRVVYPSPSPPDPGLMQELRMRFKPEVLALSEYLDRDLVSLWGYE
jgi:Sulfotransferase family